MMPVTSRELRCAAGDTDADIKAPSDVGRSRRSADDAAGGDAATGDAADGDATQPDGTARAHSAELSSAAVL